MHGIDVIIAGLWVFWGLSRVSDAISSLVTPNYRPGTTKEEQQEHYDAFHVARSHNYLHWIEGVLAVVTLIITAARFIQFFFGG